MLICLQLPAGEGGDYQEPLSRPPPRHPGGGRDHGSPGTGPAHGTPPDVGPVCGVHQRTIAPARACGHLQGW
jgi:hypothetical protein